MCAHGPARRTRGHFHVDRTGLLMDVDEGLARFGIVFLAAPFGYGKTTLLNDFERLCRLERRSTAKIVRLDVGCAESLAFMTAYREARLAGKGVGESAAVAGARLERMGGFASAGSARGPSAVGSAPCVSETACLQGSFPWSERVGRPDEACSQLLLYHVRHALLGEAASLAVGTQKDGMEPEVSQKLDLLLLLDNFPEPPDDRAAELLAGALRFWVRCGAQVVCACLPSNSLPASQFPDAPCLGSKALLVSEAEYPLWERGLCLPAGDDIWEATHGVPLLIGACRSARHASRIADDETFLGRVVRVVTSSLCEPVPRSAEGLRRALILLGSGGLGDIERLGVEVRPGDVTMLAERYPHFGIDLAAGAFSCIPLRAEGFAGPFQRIAEEDAELVLACSEALLERGRLRRAGALARLLPPPELATLLARHPLDFADLALDDVTVRGLRYAHTRDAVDDETCSRLVRLDALRSYLRDARRMLGERCPDEGGPFAGLADLRVLDALVGAWKRATAMHEARRGQEEEIQRLGCVGEDGPRGLDEICGLSALAAVRGDAYALGRVRETLVEMGASLPDLLRRAVLHHVALCDILTGGYAHAMALLAPEVGGHTWAQEGRSEGVATVSGALLEMDYAVASLLVELPCAHGVTKAALERLAAVRAFLDRRGIAQMRPLVHLAEAVSLLACGRETQARGPLEECLAAFGARGNTFAQAVCALGLADACLTRAARGQAQAFVAMADQLARRLGLRSLRALCDLLRTLAGMGEDASRDQDKRLLEVTLLQSALRPRTSVPLEIERAALCAARGDEGEAREIFEGIAQAGRPVDVRLACLAVRCTGPMRGQLVALMPSALRRELSAIDPQAGQLVAASLSLHRVEVVPAGQATGLEVRLFGGMQAVCNGHRVSDEEWGRQKARRLLALLALHPEDALPRERVAKMMWPGVDYVMARDGLYSALSTLRGILGQKHGGPTYVLSTGDALRLNLELVDVDVRTFERLARGVLARRDAIPAAEALEACSRIEDIYGTGLNLAVDDLGMEGRLRSEELAQLFVDCMVYASGVAGDSGNPQLALWFARAAKRVGAYREDVGLATIRALEALSRRGAAIDEYLEVCAHLRDEVGVEPSGELRRAYARLVGEATWADEPRSDDVSDSSTAPAALVPAGEVGQQERPSGKGRALSAAGALPSFEGGAG